MGQVRSWVREHRRELLCANRIAVGVGLVAATGAALGGVSRAPRIGPVAGLLLAIVGVALVGDGLRRVLADATLAARPAPVLVTIEVLAAISLVAQHVLQVV